MIASLLWKEYREQRSVWLALPAFTALMIFGIWWMLEVSAPTRSFTTKRDALMGLAVVLAGAYGIVSGAMLLANEQENGTQIFLDALTGWRAPLWWAKLLAGVALTLAHSLFLVVAVACVLQGDLGSDVVLIVLWLMMISWVALSALSCGMLMSAVFPNVLAASATAVGLFGMAGLLTALLAALVNFFFKGSAGAMVVLCQVGFAVAALEGSRRIFCKNDRLRARSSIDQVASQRMTHGWSAEFGSMLWLLRQQGRVLVPVLAVTALGLTLLLSLGDVAAWTLLAAPLGVACGISAFAPEQASGAGRFLGMQRLPPGRVWLAKVGAWCLVAFGIAVLILLLEAILHRDRLEEAGAMFGFMPLLFLGLTYGLAVGQLLTLLVRKTALAVLLAGMLAGGLMLLWLPSLLVGGVPAWQWLGVPLLLLVAGRLIVWPWWSGTFRDWRSLVPMTGCSLLAAGWMAGWIGLRVVEFPDAGRPFDVATYEASLPTQELNQTGRIIRRAALESDLHELRQAAHLPPGMLTDPRVPDPKLSVVLQALRKAAEQLRKDVEQSLAQGDQAAALNGIVDLLALSRQVQQHAPGQVYWTGDFMQNQALDALEAWQNQAANDPKLLKRALKELMQHDALLPPPADQVKASYLAFRADLDALNGAYSLPMVAFQAPWERARLERAGNTLFAGWLRAAEDEPWKSAGTVSTRFGWPAWLPETDEPAGTLSTRRSVKSLFELLEYSPAAEVIGRNAPWIGVNQSLRRLRTAELRLAIALYWAEQWQEDPNNRPVPFKQMPPIRPVTKLVPRYLPSLPVDPLTGLPLQP